MLSDTELWEAIAAPLDPKQIKTRKQGSASLRYISRDAVIYRLNQVCPSEWEFRAEMISTPEHGGWVCKGTLTIRGVTREDFGVPDNADYFDPPKAAASDALKRCASQFGFALELYGEEPQAPGAGNQGNGTQKQSHWIDDPEKRKAFWRYTKEDLALTEAQVYAALGVQHVHDFTGNMAVAKDKLDIYADAKADNGSEEQ